jgi:hypothetical protein
VGEIEVESSTGGSNGSNGSSDRIRWSTSERTHSRLSSLQSPLLSRAHFASQHGESFGGLRDLYQILGYERFLQPFHYRQRYERGGIAKTIVERFPMSIWGNGFAVVENPNPKTFTRYERAIADLYERLEVQEKLLRAAILAQLGRYAVIFIGAKGDLETELLRTGNPDDIWHLTPLSEEYADIDTYDDAVTSRRYGKPEFYKLTLGINTRTLTSRKVHWSRVIHIAEGCLSNDLFGTPVLQAVWNYLDDLDKIVGGGSESTWRRMSPGLLAKLDPDPKRTFTPEQLANMENEIEDYKHGIDDVIKLRGVEIEQLSSSVPNFSTNAHTIMQLISGALSIPFRVLFGAEMGQLASTQDRSNFNDRKAEKILHEADPVVRSLNQRFIDYGYLPNPRGGLRAYEVIWPEEEENTELEKAQICEIFARANLAQKNAGGKMIMSDSEMRDLHLGLEPLQEESAQVQAQGEEQAPANENEQDEEEKEVSRAASRESAAKSASASPVSRRLRASMWRNSNVQGRMRLAKQMIQERER